jgi:hypothetical protein
MKTAFRKAAIAIANTADGAVEGLLRVIDPKYAKLCSRAEALGKWNPLAPVDAQPCPDGNHEFVTGLEMAYCKRCPAIIRADREDIPR